MVLHAIFSFLIKSSSKLLVTSTGIKAWTSSISGLWFPWLIYMFLEMRFDLGTLDSGERSLPFGLLVTMSVFVKPLIDWFMFGMVIETGPKFYMVSFPAQKVTDSEFLYKSFVINVLQFQFFFAKPSMDLINCGVTIEPCLKFYAVPSQSQCMTLRSRSQT